VLYGIDEAHVLFDARSWKASSAALTFYNSQHAKLRDDVIFVTQFLKLLEVRVRGFAEQFHVYRNFFGVKAFSILRMPRRIRELQYSVEPGPGAGAPDQEKWRTLDLKKAACYDTMAGVAVVGGRKPDERKGKGFGVPWWVPLVALVAFGVFMSWSVRHGSSAVRKGLMMTTAKPTHSAAVAETPGSVVTAAEMVAVSPSPAATPFAPVLLIKGTLRREQELRYVLSTGEVVLGSQVKRRDRQKVELLDGRVAYFHAPPAPPVNVVKIGPGSIPRPPMMTTLGRPAYRPLVRN